LKDKQRIELSVSTDGVIRITCLTEHPSSAVFVNELESPFNTNTDLRSTRTDAPNLIYAITDVPVVPIVPDVPAVPVVPGVINQGLFTMLTRTLAISIGVNITVLEACINNDKANEALCRPGSMMNAAPQTSDGRPCKTTLAGETGGPSRMISVAKCSTTKQPRANGTFN
jgi:hypothetical protein